MSLARPELAPVLAALWLAAAALVLAARRRARRRRLLLEGRRTPPPRRSDLLLLLALAAVALAVAGPRVGRRVVEVPARGIDLVLLMDVSRSMDARDVPPSRLARARRAASETLARLRPGDRAALAVFAGDAALLTPLTPDGQALTEMVAALDTDLMSDAASQGAAGVRRALDAFDPESLRPRVLLLLSDGESEGLGAARVAARAAEMEVRIVAALFGSAEGATVPAAGDVLRRADGTPVRTRREREPAEALTARTGGRVLLADRFGEIAPKALEAALRAGAVPTAEGTLRREVPVARHGAPALLALALLVLEALPGGLARRALRAGRAGVRRLRRRGGGAVAAGVAALLTVAAGPPEPVEPSRPPAGRAPAQAPPLPEAEAAAEDAVLRAEQARREAAVREAPGDPRRLLALGVARARAGELEEASRAFTAAALRARDPSLAAKAFYDLGLTALARRDLLRARDAFLDALAFDPDDEEARRRLAWTLRALEAEQPEPPPSPGAARSGSSPSAAPRERGAAQDEATPSGEGAEAPDQADPRREGGAPRQEPAPSAAADASPEASRGASPSQRREPGDGGARRGAAPLTAGQAARWLELVEDDPGRGLRAAVPGEGGSGRAGRRPRW